MLDRARRRPSITASVRQRLIPKRPRVQHRLIEPEYPPDGPTGDILAHTLRAPPAYDLVLVMIVLSLVAFGVLMVYSTTGVNSSDRFSDPLGFVKRQLFAAFVGSIGLIVASRIPTRALRKISPFCYPAAIVLLLLPLIPGVSDSAGGAARWISIAGLRWQPGEFVKLSSVVFMAGFLNRHEHRLSLFTQGVVVPGMLIGFLSCLFLLQPDFGSAAVVTIVTLGMAFCSGVRIRHLGVCALVLGIAAACAVVVSPYRMGRVVSFMSPMQDASGKGYQLIQSLIAVGTGQIGGVGIGSSQQKLLFLPAAHTDFIFAVISEELGFLGGLAVLGAFLLVLWRGLRIAQQWSEDTFAYSLAVGLTLFIVVPALLNIGVVIGLLPTKGLVLPLIGYGGTNLVVSLIALGLLLRLGREARSV